MDGAQRINMAPIPDVLARLGRWLGGFHRAFTEGVGEHRFLPRYDEAYYAGWARRARILAAEAGRDSRGFERACEAYMERIAVLTKASPTLVHGELYPHNVLVTEERTCPVDWESAAGAPGELDLASITQGWPAPDVRACEAAYREARWPDGAPREYGERLLVARAYWCLRWLGEKPEWTRSERVLRYFEELHALGTLLGGD